MTRDQGLLFTHLKMTGEAAAWVERTADWAEPTTTSAKVLEVMALMARATRTLANGKRRPWSDPQEHLVATHNFGRQAWAVLDQVLSSLPPEYRYDALHAEAMNHVAAMRKDQREQFSKRKNSSSGTLS